MLVSCIGVSCGWICSPGCCLCPTNCWSSCRSRSAIISFKACEWYSMGSPRVENGKVALLDCVTDTACNGRKAKLSWISLFFAALMGVLTSLLLTDFAFEQDPSSLPIFFPRRAWLTFSLATISLTSTQELSPFARLKNLPAFSPSCFIILTISVATSVFLCLLA